LSVVWVEPLSGQVLLLPSVAVGSVAWTGSIDAQTDLQLALSGKAGVFQLVFGVGDWVLDGLFYVLSVEHGLESNKNNVEVWEDNKLVLVHGVEVVDDNNILLKVPAEPDLRFAGVLNVMA